ncbi:DnaA N-terminal domain-containing protein, partial [Aggregatibacter sp. oral taxon 458]
MENRSDALWQSCLLQIQDKIPADDFKIWLYPLQAEATAESLLLYASNAFVQKWVIDNYLPLILDVARQASANPNLNVSVIEGIKPTAPKVE